MPGRICARRCRSLHAEKNDESRKLWQAGVNRDWRFYFTIEGDEYREKILAHPKSV
jgi:hypothetical protein